MSSTIHYHALHSGIDSSVGPHEFLKYLTTGLVDILYRQIFESSPAHEYTVSLRSVEVKVPRALSLPVLALY